MAHETTPATVIDRATLPAPIREPDAARYIGMSVAYLRQSRRLGRGPAHFRIGRAVRYHMEDLNVWLAAHRVHAIEEELLAARLPDIGEL